MTKQRIDWWLPTPSFVALPQKQKITVGQDVNELEENRKFWLKIKQQIMLRNPALAGTPEKLY